MSVGNLGQVMISENSGKFHEIDEIENNPNWKFSTECGYVITDCRIMSPQKAKKKEYRACEKCFPEKSRESANQRVEIIRDHMKIALGHDKFSVNELLNQRENEVHAVIELLFSDRTLRKCFKFRGEQIIGVFELNYRDSIEESTDEVDDE